MLGEFRTHSIEKDLGLGNINAEWFQFWITLKLTIRVSLIFKSKKGCFQDLYGYFNDSYTCFNKAARNSAIQLNGKNNQILW